MCTFQVVWLLQFWLGPVSSLRLQILALIFICTSRVAAVYTHLRADTGTNSTEQRKHWQRRVEILTIFGQMVFFPFCSTIPYSIPFLSYFLVVFSAILFFGICWHFFLTAENTKEWVKQCNTQNRELWLEIDRIANLQEELIEAISVDIIIGFENKSTELRVLWM